MEGATEYFALPVYLKRSGYSLAEHGTEIVNCRGKDAIPLYWRLFKAYGYNCYAIFDCDRNASKTRDVFNGIFCEEEWDTETENCIVRADYAYFGKGVIVKIMHIIFDYEKDMKFRPLAGEGEITGLLSNDVDFNNFLIEWNEMRKKHYNNEITDEEFEDWKLSYPKKSRFLK